MNIQGIEEQFTVRDESGRRWIAPCYSAVFYFRALDAKDEVEELIHASTELLDQRLRALFINSGMRSAVWSRDDLLKAASTWLARPRGGKWYCFFATEHRSEAPEAQIRGVLMLARSTSGKGATKADIRRGLEMIDAELADPTLPPAKAALYASQRAAILEAVAHGPQPPRMSDSLFEVCAPLSLFRNPSTFAQWVKDRKLAASERLVSAHAGVALNLGYLPSDEVDTAASRRLAGMLLRHPAVDWEYSDIASRRSRQIDMGPSPAPYDDHYVKRARWLNLISARLVERLGGIAAVRAMCENHEHVSLEAVGKNTLIQAGTSPDPTGEAGAELLHALRHVNRFLKPAHGRSMGSPSGAPKDFDESYLSLGETDE
jgi:hypothetical protein